MDSEMENLRLQIRDAEARAEIEQLKTVIRDNNHLAARQIIPAEMAVDDLWAEVERLNNECNEWVKRLKEKEKGFAITLHAKSSEIERKNKLIEQMREALSKCNHLSHYTVGEHEALASIMQQIRETSKAALEAAERGE